MASEVKCPYNDEVILQSVAEKDSTFNILTPFSFSKMEDYSYAISEGLTSAYEPDCVKHYDEAGNYIYTEYKKNPDGSQIYTNNVILSASGYNFHFPFLLDEHTQSQGLFILYGNSNNSIGWNNSWGVANGSTTYSFGNSWSFEIDDMKCVNFQSQFNDLPFQQAFSGRLGLNPTFKCGYGVLKRVDGGKYIRNFYISDNNAIVDFFINGGVENFSYLKLNVAQNSVDGLDIANTNAKNDFYVYKGDMANGDEKILRSVYASGVEIESHTAEKIIQLKEDYEARKAYSASNPGWYTRNYVNGYKDITGETPIVYTPAQLEALLGIDMNNPETWTFKEKPEGESQTVTFRWCWKIYGAYWFNNRLKFMECDSFLQDKFNAFMASQSLKKDYTSWNSLITYVTQLNSDIIYDNIEYASIVLQKQRRNRHNYKGQAVYEWIDEDEWIKPNYVPASDPKTRVIVGSVVRLSMMDDNIPGNIPDNDILYHKGSVFTLTTPNVAVKPNFFMNDVFFIDFPCYKFWGDTMKNIETTNFSYDAKTNRTTFQLKIDGLMPDDITISCDLKDNWRIVGKTQSYIIPPIWDRSSDYKENFKEHFVSVTDSARNYYPVTTGLTDKEQPMLYLRDTAKRGENDGITFGNHQGKLTLGSRYPMTPNAAVRFITKTIFTVEVDDDVVEHNFIISSPSIEQSVEKLVRYNRLDTTDNIKFEKLDPTIDRVVNGCTLHAYMYDATKIKAKYELSGGKELSFKNENVYITLSDNTGEGKSVVDLKLSDIANGEYGDLIFSSGLVKNEAEKCYEFTIFISAKCSNADFDGLGFNDSTVLVRFDVDDEYKELYNLRDIDYHTVYITALPPYLVQGIPFTREPELEQVLNSEISPENASARVDYLHNSYQDNSYGYTQDALFTNASPLYVCVASAFIPNHFNGTISGLDCTMYDTWTNCRRSIPWESADAGTADYTVITSAGTGGYSTTNTDKVGTANLKLWTIEQTLDVESVRNKRGTVSNRLEVSAHLDYTTIDESLETQNMVVIRSSN